MATWQHFAQAEPEMSALGLRLLEQHHLAYIATVRRDGSPRLHPVAPFIAAGEFVVATPRTSPKAGDQLRDPRVVIHLLPGKDDDEFMMRCRARPMTGTPERARVREEGPHFVKDDDHYFAYDLREVMAPHWVNVGQPGTYPVRRTWVAP